MDTRPLVWNAQRATSLFCHPSLPWHVFSSLGTGRLGIRGSFFCGQECFKADCPCPELCPCRKERGAHSSCGTLLQGSVSYRARDTRSHPAHPHLSRKLTRLCTISPNHGSRCSRTLTSARVRYLSPHAIATALRLTLTYRQMGRSIHLGASDLPAPCARATHFRRSAKSQPTFRDRTTQKMVGLPAASDR